jgi:hypothetical protein
LQYDKSNAGNKGIVRLLRRVSAKLLLRLHEWLTLMVHHDRRFALASSGARDHLMHCRQTAAGSSSQIRL